MFRRFHLGLMAASPFVFMILVNISGGEAGGGAVKSVGFTQARGGAAEN